MGRGCQPGARRFRHHARRRWPALRSRAGGLFKLQDLLDQAEEQALAVVTQKNPQLPEAQRRQIARSVGVGGIKYFDMSRDRISDYAFSFDRMLALDGNTAPYLQYAYARTRSILREGQNRGIAYGGAAVTTIRLESAHELAIAKHILRLGDVVELVARELKPHHLCTYLYDLATRLSGFYENCPVLQSDDATRSSRLALVDLTGQTLALGLDLLGIEHPEKM